MSQKRLIIGIAGYAGCGKSTAAVYLQSIGFKRINFADRLKDIVSVMFGWDREMLEGETTVSRDWRETSDETWSNVLGMDVIPRKMLRMVGSEMVRDVLHKDFWVKCVEMQVGSTPDLNVVIADIRFDNEAEAVHRMGGKVLLIKRLGVESNGQHSSEAGIDDKLVDLVVQNDSSLESFYEKLSAIATTGEV